MKKILILIVFFYFLVLIQTSFLVHFKIFSLFNLIFVSQILITILEDPKKNQALFSALIAGFFWDIFSENFFGVGILILFLSSLFLKIILRKYVQIPPLERFQK